MEKTISQPLSLDDDFVHISKEELDSFFPFTGEGYQAICLNNGVIGPKCQNNKDSLCVIICLKRPQKFYHAWDGKNCWKCPCG